MSIDVSDYEIVTVCFGPKRFYQQAFGLARSFRLHNREWNGTFTIASDGSFPLPKDLSWVNPVLIDNTDPSETYLTKLRFANYAKASKVLFIDSDSLIYDRVEILFERFDGSPFAVSGRVISTGEWYGSIPERCEKLGVNEIPRFSGGLYYLDKERGGLEVMDLALETATQYDEIGWGRLHGRINDETCFATAMARLGIPPLEEAGDTSVSVLDAPVLRKLDVFSGERLLCPKGSGSNAWFRIQHARPVIVHFAAQSPELPPYCGELWKLKLYSKGNLPKPMATAIAFLLCDLPHRIKRVLPSFLRRSNYRNRNATRS